MLLLICQQKSGNIGFAAVRMSGIYVPKRTYTIKDYMLILDGHADAVLTHDADALLLRGAYRLPTPNEQNAFWKDKRAGTMIEEVQHG
jgi:hypothetical protein